MSVSLCGRCSQVLCRSRKCFKCSIKKLAAGVLCLGIIGFLAIFSSFSTRKFHSLRLRYSHIIQSTPHDTIAPHNPNQSKPTHSYVKPQKMLIYICFKEQGGCAGWSDRQKSITGMYLLALVTNRRFGILLQTPCDVRNFYLPNKYNWSVDTKDLEGRQQRKIHPADNLNEIDFNKKYPEDVLLAMLHSDCYYKIRANPHFKHLLPAWAMKNYNAYFHTAWNILMKPAPKIQLRLERFLKSVNYHNRSRPLVGVHMRMGRNPSNPKEGRSFNNLSSLSVVWERVGQYVKNGSQVFVASDSAQVRNQSRQRFGRYHHDSAGIIMHVGKQKHDPNACQGFEDAIVDQLFLSYCDVLFRSKGGFGMRASLMTNYVKKMFNFQNGRLT